LSSSPQQVKRALIPQIEPWIDESELHELQRVIHSTFLIEHDLTREFENMTARLTGSKHAIAVCNGTLGLYICLKALGIGRGDEVIVPNLTFVATANAVILAGATPVLCEIREDTFCLDVSHAEKLLTKRTRAIIPVHLYGQSADLSAIGDFARRQSIKLIEDAAQGIGVKFGEKHVGTFGEMGILSYYGNKTITCGEGGMILTDDDDLAKAAYRLKNHGRDQKGVFVHESIGFNFSFTELQAGVGIAQMKKLPAIVNKKRAIHDRYINELGGLRNFGAAFVDPRCEPVFWFTSFLCPNADELSAFLRGQSIQTRRFFYPLHLQPCYADRKYVRGIDADFSISESVYHQGISLPSSYGLTWEEQSHVVEQVRRFYASRD
jgi:perosamine synthetase